MKIIIQKYLAFLFFIPFVLVSQTSPFFISVDKSEHVPVDSSFQLSITLNLPFENHDSLEIYFLLDSGDKIQNIILQNDSVKKVIKLQKKYFVNKTELRPVISLSAKPKRIVKNTFQLLVTFEPNSKEIVDIGLGVKLFSKSKLIETYNSKTDYSYNKLLPNIQIKRYSSNSKAGEAIKLASGKNLGYKVECDFNEKIIIEFWGQFKNFAGSFFSLQTETNNLLTLESNKFQMINPTVENPDGANEVMFVGKYSWTYFLIEINPAENLIWVFINDKVHSRVENFNLAGINEITALFFNDSPSSFYLDNLRIWHSKNERERFAANKHFTSVSVDSSSILIYENFDEPKNFKNTFSANQISSENYEFVKSNAPIFSRIPKINVYSYNEFYSIEWYNEEISDVKYYEIEKSSSGKKFAPIFKRVGEDDADHVYFYSDTKDVVREIIYYRIKQVNKDGSVIYSATIKIGQGEIEKFSLAQNYPNPFNPKTTISLEVFAADEYDISVYDIVGKEIEKIHSGSLSQGAHTFTFDGSKIPSGLYFFEVKNNFSSQVVKMILAK
ncbi:MAG: T9SS type A sorting domain-containing protein [Bacteroidetes bacterium]|nr:T9SS type A sorting domain-containing protein [Bacteroidota bacterium]MBU1677686.1 T9SS type A sorting domain-containing protein [Bacteroidota bacterium]MBU2505655.1 T9SS type A sorting domain-containing protein [Bacteroidota bacterium]